MPETETKKRGRPPGQTRANGANVSAGRPRSLTAAEQARYAHWRAWWQARPAAQPSARALAARMEEPDSTVRQAANGLRPPGAVLLANLESLSAAYGYSPLTVDHQML